MVPGRSPSSAFKDAPRTLAGLALGSENVGLFLVPRSLIMGKCEPTLLDRVFHSSVGVLIDNRGHPLNILFFESGEVFFFSVKQPKPRAATGEKK